MPDIEWDDWYLSREDGRWLAASNGTLAFYEATYAALLEAKARGDLETVMAHVARLRALLHLPER